MSDLYQRFERVMIVFQDVSKGEPEDSGYMFGELSVDIRLYAERRLKELNDQCRSKGVHYVLLSSGHACAGEKLSDCMWSFAFHYNGAHDIGDLKRDMEDEEAFNAEAEDVTPTA